MLRKQFKPQDLAREGEIHLTNATIRPDVRQYATPAKAEKALTARYGRQYSLRFDYTSLVYSGRVVTSSEFGQLTSGLRNGTALGVAVYGKVKVEVAQSGPRTSRPKKL